MIYRVPPVFISVLVLITKLVYVYMWKWDKNKQKNYCATTTTDISQRTYSQALPEFIRVFAHSTKSSIVDGQAATSLES